MKHPLPYLLIAGLSIYGCDDQSLSDVQSETDTTIPSSRILFNPTDSEVSLPSDILILTTTDGTLDLPVEDASNFSDPTVALSAIDGWGTNMPFAIEVEYPGAAMGVSGLNATSVATPGAIRLFEVLLGNPLSEDPDCMTVSSGLLCKMVSELSWGTDFITQESSGSIAVVPLKPFEPKTSYMVAVTDMVEDEAGRALEPSETYVLLKQDITTHPLGSESQLALQAAVNSYEAGLATQGIDSSSVIYAMPFSTQSAGDVLEVVRLTIAQMQPTLSDVTDTGLTAQQMLELDPTSESGIVASAAKVYTASLTLPYMSVYPNYEGADSDNTTCDIVQLASEGMCEAINGFWTAEGDSPVTVSGALQSGALSQEEFAVQAMAQGLTEEQLNDPTAWAGLDFNITLENGTQVPVDSERHLTRYNPIPAIRNMRTVDVLITVPDEAVVSALTGNTVTKPAAGWPTVVYVHGITSLKETGLAAAGSMAMAGMATIAIDLPLHGSRSWDAGDGGAYEITTTSASNGDAYVNGNAAVYVNFNSLLTIRDNLRQSVSDILTLKASLAYTAAMDIAMMQSPMFDADNSYLLGLSLGGIVGHNVVAVGNQPLLDPTTGMVSSINPFEIKAAVLASAGGGLAPVFGFSPTFGPDVEEGVKASDTFAEALAEAAGLTEEELQQLQENDPAGYQALVDAVYPGFRNQFLFAAQQVIDSGDPINYARRLADLGTPLLLTEIVGDGVTNLSDQVVINSAAEYGWPLSGTEALIATMGVTGIDSTTADEMGVTAVTRFVYGHHSSLLDPVPQEGIAPDGEKTAAVTVEMQSQVTSLFISQGTSVQIGDSSLLIPAQ